MIKILFICHGNICRSPMAQSVCAHMAGKMNMKNNLEIESAATSREEIGNPIHRGTVNKLKKLHIPVIEHRAVQISARDLDYYDHIICMDENNMKNLERMFDKDTFDSRKQKIKKLLSFAGDEGNIADPWYTGNFDITYEDIERGVKAMLNSFVR